MLPAPALGQTIEPRLLLAREPSQDATALPMGAGAAAMTSDAVYVLYLSGSPYLVTNFVSGPGINIFLRNNTAQATTLVSASTNGWTGNGVSRDPVLSGGRKHVAFSSDASNLASNDANEVSDVFLRALDTGTTRLVSVNPAGASGDGPSSEPALSSDGRWVAFTSAASDLVPGDTNGVEDVFVRDMTTGVTVLASCDSAGNPGSGPSTSPRLSTDGRYVFFLSKATNIVAGATSPLGDVFMRDLTARTNAWVGRNVQSILTSLSNPADRRVTCQSPVVSDTGRYVAFKLVSYAGWVLILRHDTTALTTDIVCTNGVGNSYSPGLGGGPSMNTSGRYVAYTARTNAAGRMQVWSWDANTKTSANASLNASGAAPTTGDSSMPSISSGGRFVAFVSSSALVAGSVDGTFDVYVRDRTTLSTKTVSVATYGTLRSDAQPTVNADGRYACFEASPTAGPADGVYLMDFTAGGATLLSEPNPGASTVAAAGDLSLERQGMRADGASVAFSTTADGLVATDANRLQDVLLLNRGSGEITLVSTSADGLASGDGWSGSAVVSADGDRVAFASVAGNLVSGDTNKAVDVFVRDIAAQRTQLVSANRTGTGPGNRESWAPSMSADGRWVAYLSYATNLTATAVSSTLPNAFLSDLLTPRTIALTTAGTDRPPLVAADGAHVLYLAGTAGSRTLASRDIAAGTIANLGSYTLGTPYGLSPNGRFVAGRRTAGITVWDLSDGSPKTLAVPSSDAVTILRQPVHVSNDGRWVVFVSRVLGGSSRAFPDVYLHDFVTGTTTLASATPDGALPGGDSGWPALSADGRWVLFQSSAWDLVLGDNNGEMDVFLFDRLVGKVHLVSRRWDGLGSGGGRSAGAFFSPDGTSIVFKSAGMDLAAGDRGAYSDLFVAGLPRNAAADADADGMDDSWESVFFGNLQRQGDGDADQDGMTDLEEFLAGTNPVQLSSRLELHADLSVPGVVRLTWPGQAGRGYVVQFKDHLEDPAWMTLPGGVVVAGGVATISDPDPAPGGQRYYRVRLVL